ncbi:universal stress protein [Hymenobacter sp. DG25A]|uniref:universal stress protein n=1 Tax=Hymenobacter sp. DG25A TaxID=1385663 RepID=UPI0006BC9B8D|nr:universal stress protein [Hymenobacter sp. DG25A]ALD21986.1 hypothetical protein AM218_13180 [Hymenobacter sp. DG25A]
MNLSLILCPLDFSAVSTPLVAYAAALAAGTGAELYLLHVLEPQPTLTVPATGTDEANGQLALYRTQAEEAGARVSTGLLQGEAPVEIVAEAQTRHADLIVIGTHGQTGLTRFLVGSTAEAVVRKAACATLLVKACPAKEYRQSA